MAAPSVGIFAYLVDQYGTRGNRVPIEDAERVEWLQRVEVAAGLTFFGLYAIGVIDAMRHFQPRVRLRGPPITLGPRPVRDGAGFSIAWSH